MLSLSLLFSVGEDRKCSVTENVKRFVGGDLGVTVIAGSQNETEADGSSPSFDSEMIIIVTYCSSSLVQFKHNLLISLFYLYFTNSLETSSVLFSTIMRYLTTKKKEAIVRTLFY